MEVDQAADLTTLLTSQAQAEFSDPGRDKVLKTAIIFLSPSKFSHVFPIVNCQFFTCDLTLAPMILLWRKGTMTLPIAGHGGPPGFQRRALGGGAWRAKIVLWVVGSEDLAHCRQQLVGKR